MSGVRGGPRAAQSSARDDATRVGAAAAASRLGGGARAAGAHRRRAARPQAAARRPQARAGARTRRPARRRPRARPPPRPPAPRAPPRRRSPGRGAAWGQARPGARRRAGEARGALKGRCCAARAQPGCASASRHASWAPCIGRCGACPACHGRRGPAGHAPGLHAFQAQPHGRARGAATRAPPHPGAAGGTLGRRRGRRARSAASSAPKGRHTPGGTSKQPSRAATRASSPHAAALAPHVAGVASARGSTTACATRGSSAAPPTAARQERARARSSRELSGGPAPSWPEAGLWRRGAGARQGACLGQAGACCGTAQARSAPSLTPTSAAGQGRASVAARRAGESGPPLGRPARSAAAPAPASALARAALGEAPSEAPPAGAARSVTPSWLAASSTTWPARPAPARRPTHAVTAPEQQPRDAGFTANVSASRQRSSHARGGRTERARQPQTQRSTKGASVPAWTGPRDTARCRKRARRSCKRRVAAAERRPRAPARLPLEARACGARRAGKRTPCAGRAGRHGRPVQRGGGPLGARTQQWAHVSVQRVCVLAHDENDALLPRAHACARARGTVAAGSRPRGRPPARGRGPRTLPAGAYNSGRRALSGARAEAAAGRRARRGARAGGPGGSAAERWPARQTCEPARRRFARRRPVRWSPARRRRPFPGNKHERERV